MIGVRAVDSASGAVIKTMYLPPSGKTFIEDMKEAFAGEVVPKEVEAAETPGTDTVQ